MPPREWGVGAHAKHLRNLYVYFWRWATWKVFDHDPTANTGIVCFITVSGFLNGPGFEKMRDYLRRTADDVWVIDCSPEGHQPEVNTRIFEGVQQPVCIVLVSRSPGADPETPARVRFRALPTGRREDKFAALADVTLDGAGWADCPSEWRAPFLPESAEAWATYPALDDFFLYNGIRRDAGPHLGHRPGRGVSGATLADADSCPGRPERGIVPSASPRWAAGRQTHREGGGEGIARLRSPADAHRHGAGVLYPAGALWIPLLRPAVDHPRQPADQSAQPDVVGVALAAAGVLDGPHAHGRRRRVPP